MDPKQPQPPRQVFDVSRPSQSQPNPTSRPVIVGHQPQASDPMVHPHPPAPQMAQPAPPPPPPPPPTPQPAPMPLPNVALPHLQPMTQPVVQPTPAAPPAPAAPESTKMHWLVWIILALLAVIVGLYLAIDAGLLRGASHLPFHIFKQT